MSEKLDYSEKDHVEIIRLYYFLIHLKFQSFAQRFLLIFDKLWQCAGTQKVSSKKKAEKVWTLRKFALPLHPLS
jgi:hypothetical protein